MEPYNALGERFRTQFRMFATAVAGERALAVAAGLPPMSVKQWTRAEAFRAAFMKEVQDALQRFHEDYLGNASTEFSQRSALRFAWLVLDLSRISGEIVQQSIRQATFGKEAPISILKGSRMGAGAIGRLAQQRLANPDFKVSDSAGRKWDGEKLVQTLVRDFAYQAFIDHQFDQAIKDGADFVTIEHPDGWDHPEHGTLISLHHDWLEVRDRTFHINSNLTISHVSVSS